MEKIKEHMTETKEVIDIVKLEKYENQPQDQTQIGIENSEETCVKFKETEKVPSEVLPKIKEKRKLTLHQLENKRKVTEMAEFAKFESKDVSTATKEKLFKMTEKEKKENGIESLADEVRVFNLEFSS